MGNVRIPAAVSAAVAEVLEGSHEYLNARFEEAGAPGFPPNMPHQKKWKTWIQRAGNDPDVDSLKFLGILIEEFMDLPPLDEPINVNPFVLSPVDPLEHYNKKRHRLNQVLEEHGFRYYRGGQVLTSGVSNPIQQPNPKANRDEGNKPKNVEELLRILIKGLPRAMQPLIHRRKDSQALSFSSEYDIQDLLHALMKPWISDIRPEEFTPSYAGTNTRMDFLLPDHKLVIETKRVRSKSHANKVGDELIIDIEHYRRHSSCDHLWCVIYDPEIFISNPQGLIADLEGKRVTPDGEVQVKVFVFGASA